MSKQIAKRNLLIVCEGTVTEPFYFRILADKAIEAGIWDVVDIIPTPRLLEDTEERIQKSKRAKRAFKNMESEIPKNTLLKADAIEEKYLNNAVEKWATPLNFVKQARDRLANGIYDEAWVVFDRNGHPAHEAAFALAAENDKRVLIAFSSRSFEQWVLLHFEKTQTPFEATECKTRIKNKNIPLDCMGNQPLEGSCEGDKCLVGYIRRKYLPDYSKKGSSLLSVFKTLSKQENIYEAITNAAWLRAKQRHILRGCNNRLYLVNPYTTVDVLVKRLFGIVENIEWVTLGEAIRIRNIELTFELIDEKHLKITFNNKGRTIFMLNEANLANKLYIISENTNHYFNLGKVFSLPPNEIDSCVFDLPKSNLVEPHVHFKMEDYCLIVPFRI